MSFRQREIVRFLQAVLEPGSVTEVREMERTAGYFDTNSLDELARQVIRQDAQGHALPGGGVYFIPNPLVPDVLARRANRLASWGRSYPHASDSDVARLRWVALNINPTRAVGVSATEVERKRAQAAAGTIEEELRQYGFPNPFVLDSGNGVNLLYRVDLAVNEQSVEAVRKFVDAVAMWSDQHVTVSRGWNPSRLVRLPFTLARKGDSTVDRPHRRALVLAQADPHGVARLEQLEGWVSSLGMVEEPLVDFGANLRNLAVGLSLGTGPLESAALAMRTLSASQGASQEPQQPPRSASEPGGAPASQTCAASATARAVSQKPCQSSSTRIPWWLVPGWLRTLSRPRAISQENGDTRPLTSGSLESAASSIARSSASSPRPQILTSRQAYALPFILILAGAVVGTAASKFAAFQSRPAERSFEAPAGAEGDA